VRALVVDPEHCRPTDLAPAVAWLRDGGIVALPTDTLYGLAVDPRSPAAVHALFSLKGRDAGVALPLIGASREQIEAVCGDLGASTRRLADACWPGPLALIVDAPASIAPAVHAGTGTLAVRVPAHAVARALAEAAGHLLTATSANRSGAPPAMTAGALMGLAEDARVLVVDGGAVPGGAPSTIVDARGARPVLVRAGAIAWDRVLKSWRE
jgi:L-threonylcarbamoyladenylate synthase